MLRILRAFGWFRWRVLINSLERHGGRDTLQRFSIATEQLMPIVVALVMIPSAISLAGVAAYTGWSLAQGGSPPVVVRSLRVILLAGFAFAVAGPVLLPAGDRTNAVRLTLLPIPRAVLYVAQAISTLADPWMVLTGAAIVALPLGFLAGGAAGSAAVSAATGILLLVALAGVALLVTNVVHLAVRDRRRGEILTLIVLLALPMLGVLPGVIEHRTQRTGGVRSAEERAHHAPDWWRDLERQALSLVPPEMYLSATVNWARSHYSATARSVVMLCSVTVVLHGVAYLAFSRVLGSPATSGGTRAAAGIRFTGWRIPLATAGTSGVALNQLKLALRTPRGRASILAPFMMFAALALVSGRAAQDVRFGAIPLGDGQGIASFACFVALLSVLPLAMNQFAVDRAGLTLALLAPLETRSLLVGKAIGNAMVAAIPAGGCLAGAIVLFRSDDPILWLCIPLALIATYLPVAPLAAILSAMFPRAVDLNSVGQGSNAHGAAGLLGVLAFVAAGAPCLLMVVAATRVLGRPALAPLFLIGWIAACVMIAYGLFRAAAVVFERRRESLIMLE